MAIVGLLVAVALCIARELILRRRLATMTAVVRRWSCGDDATTPTGGNAVWRAHVGALEALGRAHRDDRHAID